MYGEPCTNGARADSGTDQSRVGGSKEVRADGRSATTDDGRQNQIGKEALKSGMLPRDVADDLGISLTTLYRWIPEAASLSQ